MRSLKVILTDLDGVIRHWNTNSLHRKEGSLGLTSGHLFSICFEKNLLKQAVTGQILDSEWRNIVQTKLSSSIGESSAKELVESWTNSEVLIDKKVIEIYKKHFPEAKVVLVTNATTRLDLDMRSHGLDGIFYKVINSSELGLAKPAHDYFNEALNRLGVRFDEVIYIDDTVINVESAILLGIRSHHYQNHTQLVEFLVNTQKIYL